MKRSPKRLFYSIVAVVLAIAMLPIPWPLSVWAADESTVVYEPTQLGVGVVPGYVAGNESLRGSYVMNNDSMLVTSNFQRSSSKSASITGGDSATLSKSLKFMHNENESWNVHYRWDIAEDSVLEQWMRYGQTSVAIYANLTGDNHWNGDHWTEKKFDAAQALVNAQMETFNGFSSWNLQKVAYICNNSGDPDEQAVGYFNNGSELTTGDAVDKNDFYDYRDHITSLEFVAGSTACSCGSSAVSGTRIFLTDKITPKIRAVYPSDEYGANYGGHVDRHTLDYATYDLYVSQGETGYFAIEFTEDIRLADHQAHDLGLTLSVSNTENGQPNNDVTVYATLARVTGSKLVFAFKAPEGGNYMIDKIDVSKATCTYGGKEVSWINSPETFDVVMVNSNNEPVDIGVKIHSLVTDLSGNAMQWVDDESTVMYMDNRIYTDAQAPQAVDQTVTLTDDKDKEDQKDSDQGSSFPGDIDPSSIFGAVGDKLSFTVEFDEELATLVPIAGSESADFRMPFYMDSRLNYNEEEKRLFTVGTSYTTYNPIIAETNILDQDGNPVTIRSYHVYCQAPKNSKPHTFIQFSGLVIQEGYHTADGGPAKVTSISFSNYEVTDASGNQVGDGKKVSVDVLPASEIYLDVTAPTITFGDTQVQQDTQQRSVATIPFKIADVPNAALSEQNASGLTGLNAIVTLDASGSVEYAITASASTEQVEWTPTQRTAFTMPIQEQTVYLHLRFTGSDYYISPSTGEIAGMSIAVQATDYAGMTSSVKQNITGVKVDFDDPQVKFGKSVYLDDNGGLSAKVTVTDPSRLRSITYSWNSQTPVEVTGDALDAIRIKTDYYLDATGGPTTGSGQASLTVVAEDIAGNTAELTQTYSYNLDTSLPSYSVPEGYSAITQTPSLRVDQPDRLTGSTELVTVVLATLGDTTYRFQVYSNSGSAIENLFTLQAYAQKYTGGSISFDDASETITFGGEAVSTEYVEFANAVKNYNGSITVRMFNVPSASWNPTAGSTVTARTNDVSDLVILDYLVCTNPNATITLGTPVDVNGDEVDYYGRPADSTTRTLKTLTGLSIPITVAGAYDAMGLDIIDFENSYAILVDANGAELEDTKMPLVKTDAQTYVVSKSLSGHTAEYSFKVVLAYVCGEEGRTTTQTLDLFMDDTPYSDVYPTSYMNTYTLDSYGDTTQETYGQTLNAGISEVRMGAIFTSSLEGSSKNGSYFTFHTARDDESLAAYPEFQGKNLAVKVYNQADPDGASKAQFTYSDTFAVEYVDSFPETYAADTIYVLNDPAVSQAVAYSTRMQNGSVSSERSFALNVMPQEIDFSVGYTTVDGNTNAARATMTAGNEYTQSLMDSGEYSLYLVYYVWDESGENLLTKVDQINPGAGNRWDMSRLNLDGDPVGYEGYFILDSYWNFGGEGKITDTADPNWFDLDMPRLMNANVTGLETNNQETLTRTINVDLYDPLGTIDPESMSITFYNKDSEGKRINAVTWPVTFATDLTIKPWDQNNPEDYVEGGVHLLQEGYVLGNGVFYTEAYNQSDRLAAPFGYDQITHVTIQATPPREVVSQDGENTIYVEFTVKDQSGRQVYLSDCSSVFDYVADEFKYASAKDELTPDTGMSGENYYIPYFLSTYPCRILTPLRFAEDEYTTEHYIHVFDMEDLTEVTTVDIFGNYNTYAITWPEDSNPFAQGLQAKVIENGLYEPVTVEVWNNETVNNGIYLIEFTDEEGNTTHGQIADDQLTGSIQVYTSGTVRVEASNSTNYLEIPIVANAGPDTKVEPVTAYFLDSQGMLVREGDPDVKGYVTAKLECDEELVGTLSHVFQGPANKGETYTFEYADLAGNTGSITVTLPVNVLEPDAPLVDDDAPAYAVRAYSMVKGTYRQVDGNTYDSTVEDGELTLTKLPQVLAAAQGQKYRLTFTVNDVSPTHLVVKTQETSNVTFSTESDTVEGLTVSDNAITYEGDSTQTFYVYVVDQSNNVSAMPALTFNSGDTAGPEATTEAVLMADNTVRLYLIVEEENITILDNDLILETEGDYAGRYYRLCRVNGEYYFNIADALGNASVVTGKVEIIPDSGMQLVGQVQYMAGGKTYTSMDEIPNTNGNLRIVLNFTNNIASYDTKDMDDEDEYEYEYMTYSVMGNRLSIMVAKGYSPSINLDTGEYLYPVNYLVVTDVNGNPVTVEIPMITCMDAWDLEIKVEKITVDGEEIDNRGNSAYGDVYVEIPSGKFAVIYYRVPEDVVLSDRARQVEGDPTLFYLELGAKSSAESDTVKFYDTAGNVKELHPAVNYPDPLTILFSMNPDGSDATSLPNTLPLTAGMTLYIQPSLSGDVTIGDDNSENILPEECYAYYYYWNEVTIPENATGMCFITCTTPEDYWTGQFQTVTYYLYYSPADTVAPRISLARDREVLPLGMTTAEIEAELLSRVSVWDDVDQNDVTLSLSGVNSNAAGHYIVTYTAEDKSGNRSTAEQELVLTENVVKVSIDGKPVADNDTVIVSAGNHTVTFQETGGQPLYIAIKEGFKTEAQMKTGATVLVRNQPVTQVELEGLTQGIYTLYVRTQDRGSFLIHLSVS